MSYYLDASFLVAVVVDEARSAEAREWLKQASAAAIIGSFAAIEVSAAISRGVRTTRFSDAQAMAALADFDTLRSLCETCVPARETFELAGELIRDFTTKLAAPDALHLAGAMQLGAVLVTFDDRLAKAAMAKGVAIAELAAG